MTARKPLPDLLQRTREVRGVDVFHRYANGLVVKTEVFDKRDRQRILSLGTPQGSLMNHVLGFPETVRRKRVFEPFAGSGPLGFMALKAGAARVDFLDINPRASDFHTAIAALNGFPSDRFRSVTGDIADFVPARPFDLILANPPFVPTPDGIEGTLTSNGGPEGSRFAGILIERLEDLLVPTGRALVYVLQFAKSGRPLITDLLRSTVRDRPVGITPAQRRPIPFDPYVEAYRTLFPDARETIDRWQAGLVRRHGSDLELCHYVVDVGPRSDGRADCVIRDDFVEKFGESQLVPSENAEELAFGRVFENVVPVPRTR